MQCHNCHAIGRHTSVCIIGIAEKHGCATCAAYILDGKGAGWIINANEWIPCFKCNPTATPIRSYYSTQEATK